MEAQAQGTQCGTGRNRGLDRRRHSLQGPEVSVPTWLCQAGWSGTHCPLPGRPWDPAPGRTSVGRGAAHPRPHRVPHGLSLKVGRPWGWATGRAKGRLGWAGRLGAASSAFSSAGASSPASHTETVVSRGLCVSQPERQSLPPAGQDRRLSLAAGPHQCARVQGRFRSPDPGIRARREPSDPQEWSCGSDLQAAGQG